MFNKMSNSNNINYQRILDKEIEKIKNEGKVPRLLLHSCCAPCSSYVLEYLSEYFEITDLYYNPNISPKEEHDFRAAELKRLADEMNFKNKVEVVEGRYNPEDFYEKVKGHENDKEGGERCFICYEMRLREAMEYAKKGGYDYFTTTLSISPLKNAQVLNDIGKKLEEESGVKYLYSDFKKKNGYKRSIELSREYDLYRQNYCGCVFSKNHNQIDVDN